MCIVVMCQIVLMGVLDWMYPREEMDEAPSFDYEGWKHVCFKFFLAHRAHC